MFVLRDLNEQDASCYLDLLSHLTFYIYDSVQFRPDGLIGLFDKDQLLATGKLWIELKCGDPVGHIEDIVVHPDHRGKGYGKQVVRELLRRGEEKGVYKTILSAAPHLRSFYEKCGLVESGIAFEHRSSPR